MNKLKEKIRVLTALYNIADIFNKEEDTEITINTKQLIEYELTDLHKTKAILEKIKKEDEIISNYHIDFNCDFEEIDEEVTKVIIVEISDNFLEKAKEKIIHLNNEINYNGNKTMLFYSVASFELKTTESDHPSTKTYKANTQKQKNIFYHLFLRYQNNQRTIIGEELGKLAGYGGDGSSIKNQVSKEVKNLNEFVKELFENNSDLILRKGGYKINTNNYEIKECP